MLKLLDLINQKAEGQVEGTCGSPPEVEPTSNMDASPQTWAWSSEEKAGDSEEKSATAATARREPSSGTSPVSATGVPSVMELLSGMRNRQAKDISRIKRMQWCHYCEREAVYYCCWYAQYCSIECQQLHWKRGHKSACIRKKPAA